MECEECEERAAQQAQKNGITKWGDAQTMHTGNAKAFPPA
jgi:hypothetical protein